MTTTPWDEARREALNAAEEAFHSSIFVLRGRISGESSTTHQVRHATNACLSTLSRLGYRLVPAEATEEMQIVALQPALFGCKAMINAATEAGDVLRVKP